MEERVKDVKCVYITYNRIAKYICCLEVGRIINC